MTGDSDVNSNVTGSMVANDLNNSNSNVTSPKVAQGNSNGNRDVSHNSTTYANYPL